MAWKRHPQLQQTDAANNDGWAVHVKWKLVCFPCRKVYKSGSSTPYGYSGTSKCSHCGGELMNCGKDWRFPRRHDLKGWKKAEEYWTERKRKPAPRSQHAPGGMFSGSWWRPRATSGRPNKHNQPSNWYY